MKILSEEILLFLALGKQGKRDGGAYDVELRIMHPTMTRGMVVSNIVSGVM